MKLKDLIIKLEVFRDKYNFGNLDISNIKKLSDIISNDLIDIANTVGVEKDENMTADERHENFLKSRIRLRCTGKDCELRSGFFTPKKHKKYYLTKARCLLCGSKNAEELKGVD